MRLIDADALLNQMGKTYEEKVKIVNDNLAEGFMQMEKLIKMQPTIEAELVVHGKWENENWYLRMLKCSNCKKITQMPQFMPNVKFRYPVCPNCGAKMKGGD